MSVLFSRTRAKLAAALASTVAATVLVGAAPALTASAPAHATETAPATTSAQPVRINGVLLTAYEAQLVRKVNATRKARNLAPLKVTACAEDFARRWTKVMSRKNQLFHNPKLTLIWTDSWCDKTTMVAENVGYSWGTTADSVFKAYMASPGHKANILHKKATLIGIGAIRRADGKVFNTMNFVNGASADYRQTKVLGQSLTSH